MNGEHGDRLDVERWELELAKVIAAAFRPMDQDLAARLLERLWELKVKKPTGVRNWKAFLAQSFYKAAKNYIRHEDVIRHREQSFDVGWMAEIKLTLSLDELPAVPSELTRSGVVFSKIRSQLIPEMRALADLLVEKEGNISAVASALGRPRKTVEYRIEKLRTLLKTHGLEP